VREIVLDLKFLRENQDKVRKNLQGRGEKIDLGKIMEIDLQRRQLLKEVEELKHKRNLESKNIGKALQEGKKAENEKKKMRELSQRIKDLDGQVKEKEEGFYSLLLTLPNICHDTVPEGRDETANQIVREWGKKPKFSFQPSTHLQLAEVLDILDFSRAAKLTGSNFPLYKNSGALLERALINFMLDLHTQEHSYSEISPPFVVNRKAMMGTGQLPKLEEDMYRIGEEDYFLVPTAEVPLTNLHAGEVLKEEDLPLYYTAYTPCFRREAGSYGEETKGLMRVHQFDKVELVKFARQEDSFTELEKMVNNAEEVLKKLNLPYRLILLCQGEIGFAAAKCYDLEVWASGSKRYLEVSSCSNCTDFQARRINIKYKTKDKGRTAYVHTLNGSGVALARTVIALLENYQQEDGSVIIPEVLRPYMQGRTRIEKI